MESIAGLPTHVLMVHAPVVLMPLALLLNIAMAIRPSWRRATGVLQPGVAVVVFLATLLAVLSGNKFDEVVGDRVDTSDHKSLAMSSLWLVGGFALATIGVAVLDRLSNGTEATWHRPVARLALVASVVLAALATLWMVRTGDEGARLVWDGVI
ncbi:MAG: DUF2231 domain-containing protein [Acidimicrobiales bacterium]